MTSINYDKLFELTEARGLSRTELTHLAGISTNMMAKLGKNESVHLSVLCKICKALNCELNEIVTINE